MTNQEALNYFKEKLKDGKYSDTCPMCNAMEVAIQALEKQTPKKPKEDFNSVLRYKCPNCNSFVMSDFPLICIKCGQALDWSDENDT